MLNYLRNFHLLLLLFLTIICPSQIIHASSSFKRQSPPSGFAYIEPQTIERFVTELNRLGKLGYKLRVTERYTQFSPPENYRELKIAGIVEHLSGNVYEYKWFSALTLPQLIFKIDAPAKEGFYFSNLINYGTSEKKEPPEVDAEAGTLIHRIDEEEANDLIIDVAATSDLEVPENTDYWHMPILTVEDLLRFVATFPQK